MTKEDDASSAQPQPLGEEGDTCAQCGTALATDQRYCLTCGTARAEPRLDFQRHLAGSERAASGAASPGSGGTAGVQWSPILVIVAIAALGVMLLLGVLIGKDDNEVTVTEVPASTTTTTATAPATPTTTPTTTTPSTEGTTSVPDASGSPDGTANGTRKQDAAGSGGLAPGGTD